MLAITDNGKDSFKYIINNERHIIPSKVEEGIATFSDETLLYKGKNYIIGDEAIDYNYTFTKNNNHHKIMLYYCLAKHTEQLQVFDLITGCPLSTYLNKQEQDKYIQSLQNNGNPIVVEYKGEEKKFVIRSITIVPESIGGYLNDYSKSKYEIRGVVDIGGLNLNAGIYNMGKPVKDKMLTLNLGIHILLKNIQQAVLREKEEIINLYMCKHLLISKQFTDDSLKEIFDKECTKFVKLIKKTLIKNDWEINQLSMRFIGGGSIALKEFIEAEFYNCYIEDDVFANCEAFKKFGMSKLNAKK